MIERILVPLDGSDNANAALEVAADIAEKTGAHLKLLHVGLRQPGSLTALYEAAERSFDQAETVGGWTSDHPNWPRRLQILDHMGQMILNDGQTFAFDRGATAVETVLDWGEEGERILHHSKHPAVDMIVMGSRGASPLEGLFLGSVSHKVFHLAPCTCVTVHAAEGRSGLGKLERIVVPFDGSDHATMAVELACDLAEKFAAGLKLVHVLQHEKSADQLLGAVDEKKLDIETHRALEDARNAGSLGMGAVFALPPIPHKAMTNIAEEILVPRQRDRSTARTDRRGDGDPRWRSGQLHPRGGRSRWSRPDRPRHARTRRSGRAAGRERILQGEPPGALHLHHGEVAR